MKIMENINLNGYVNNINMNSQQLSIGNADVLYTTVRKITCDKNIASFAI